MSPTIGRLFRPILKAAFLPIALVATPALHGQDGARALLSQTGDPDHSLAAYAAYNVPAASVNGERALLGHFGAGLIPTAPQLDLLASDTVAQVIDGARALTGRPATTRARRSLVAKSQ
jgi:hypothetical protein